MQHHHKTLPAAVGRSHRLSGLTLKTVSPLALVLNTSCRPTFSLAPPSRHSRLRIGRFEFELSADVDTAILATGAQAGNANFESVSVMTRLTTNASDEELVALRLETERRCPISRLFARCRVAISTTWARIEA